MRSRNPKSVRALFAIVLGCAPTLISCGGGGQSNASTPSTALSGNWQMTLQETSPASSTTAESGFLLQSGDSLAGSVLLSGDALCEGIGSAQGTVNGSNVTIAVSQTAQTISLTGTTSSDGSSMNGNYSILGSACGGSTLGNWTANQLKPVSGNYVATFTSGEQLGLVYSYSVSVTQGPNTGTANATLSGTLTSTNAPCSSSLNLAGVVGGTSIAFNLLEPDGTAVGQFRGTTSLDATTMTGTYDFNPVGTCFGDAGTISISGRASM